MPRLTLIACLCLVTTASADWTPYRASPDTRTVYVAATGNDTSPGTKAAPLRTIAAGYAKLRNGYPDWLLLRAGDTWKATFPDWSKSGRSAAEPMRVDQYVEVCPADFNGDGYVDGIDSDQFDNAFDAGSMAADYNRDGFVDGIDSDAFHNDFAAGCFGARPTIDSGARTAMDSQTVPIRHLAIVGLRFTASTWAGTGGECVGVRLVCSGGDILLEDCLFQGFRVGVNIQGWGGRLDGVRINRCVFRDPLSDAGTSSLYIDNSDGVVLTDCLFLNSAENDAKSYVAHHAYLHESCGPVVVQGCIAFNARTNLTARPGGLVQGNLSIRGGQGFQVGWDTYRASTVKGNVCTESRNHQNGQPLGIGIVLSHQDGSVVSDNVIARGTDGGDHYGIFVEGTNRAFELTGNVVVNWNGGQWEEPCLYFKGAPQGTVRVTANDFQHTAQKLCYQAEWTFPGSVVFTGNRLWTARPTVAASPSVSYSFAAWDALSNTTDRREKAVYPSVARTVGSYGAPLGAGATSESFLLAAATRSRANWQRKFEAGAVIEYIRAGVGK